MKIKMQVENRIPAKSTVQEKKRYNNRRTKCIFQLCQVNNKLERKVGKAKELLKGQVQH